MAETRTEIQTRYARELFLFGKGDGKPIRNTRKLSELSGAAEKTIRSWLPTWEKESAEIAAQGSPTALALHLSAETLDQDKRDRAFVRDQVDQLTWELQNLDELTAKLEGLTDRFAELALDGEQELLEKAMRTFNAWLQGAGMKSKLRTQYIAMKKLWDEKQGLDAARGVAEVSAREMAKTAARLQARKDVSSDRGEEPRRIGGGVFGAGPDAR